MSVILSCSINVTKLDTTKFITGKDGKTKYANIDVIINDTQDKFGNDASISITQTKEERESKEKKVYIGSGRKIWTTETGPIRRNAPAQAAQQATDNYSQPQPTATPLHSKFDDDLPF